jgi:hypothetical protein
MFNDLIDRFGTNLGLSHDAALQSDLVKKLCVELLHGQTVVIDSNRNEATALNSHKLPIDEHFSVSKKEF